MSYDATYSDPVEWTRAKLLDAYATAERAAVCDSYEGGHHRDDLRARVGAIRAELDRRAEAAEERIGILERVARAARAVAKDAEMVGSIMCVEPELIEELRCELDETGTP